MDQAFQFLQVGGHPVPIPRLLRQQFRRGVCGEELQGEPGIFAAQLEDVLRKQRLRQAYFPDVRYFGAGLCQERGDHDGGQNRQPQDGSDEEDEAGALGWALVSVHFAAEGHIRKAWIPWLPPSPRQDAIMQLDVLA